MADVRVFLSADVQIAQVEDHADTWAILRLLHGPGQSGQIRLNDEVSLTLLLGSQQVRDLARRLADLVEELPPE